MLPAGAAERDRQILEAPALIVADACVPQRSGVRQILVNALLLVEIVDHRPVLPGKRLEAFFASRIRETADIENKSAAVSGLVFRRAAAVKRKAEDSYHQLFCLGSRRG